eukprot:CAMPEP_0197857284 /NCGR_PEP_ID=MMETSP1438-20131217/30186_1 /TAXON_ID=1461541 /ORGANISM="Pterosperma sp., Strain CCMP1384" /LENGTH=98 /DNA_ID=CAMNT_0043473061 /DNA_START=27 /DNA_END=319 /DNA_ORIENTATION=-
MSFRKQATYPSTPWLCCLFVVCLACFVSTTAHARSTPNRKVLEEVEAEDVGWVPDPETEREHQIAAGWQNHLEVEDDMGEEERGAEEAGEVAEEVDAG